MQGVSLRMGQGWGRDGEVSSRRNHRLGVHVIFIAPKMPLSIAHVVDESNKLTIFAQAYQCCTKLKVTVTGQLRTDRATKLGSITWCAKRSLWHEGACRSGPCQWESQLHSLLVLFHTHLSICHLLLYILTVTPYLFSPILFDLLVFDELSRVNHEYLPILSVACETQYTQIT